MLERAELPPGHGDRLLGLPELGAVAPGRQVGLELGRHLLDSAASSPSCSGARSAASRLGGRQLLGQPGPLGLEGGDHVGVGGGVEGLGQGALPLPQHPGQAAGPLDHPLGPAEGGGQVGLALGRQLVGGPLGVGVELRRATSGARSSVARCSLLGLEPVGLPAVEGAELGPGHVEPHGAQLVGQAGVGAGRGRLALERAGSDA